MTRAVNLASAGSIVSESVGTAPGYMARAWVNFNGTGTVAIRASGNVSSITDNGVGDYTVNFTTAMSDANYSLIVAKTNTTPGSNYLHTALFPTDLSASSGRLYFRTDVDGAADPTIVCAAVFR